MAAVAVARSRQKAADEERKKRREELPLLEDLARYFPSLAVTLTTTTTGSSDTGIGTGITVGSGRGLRWNSVSGKPLRTLLNTRTTLTFGLRDVNALMQSSVCN